MLVQGHLLLSGGHGFGCGLPDVTILLIKWMNTEVKSLLFKNTCHSWDVGILTGIQAREIKPTKQ